MSHSSVGYNLCMYDEMNACDIPSCPLFSSLLLCRSITLALSLSLFLSFSPSMSLCRPVTRSLFLVLFVAVLFLLSLSFSRARTRSLNTHKHTQMHTRTICMRKRRSKGLTEYFAVSRRRMGMCNVDRRNVLRFFSCFCVVC